MKAVQVVLTILSFSVFELATCWSCYSCSHLNGTEETAHCEQFNSTAVPVVDCDQQYNMSSVGCITYTLAYENKVQLYRGCAVYNATTELSCANINADNEKYNGTVTCYLCHSSLCNSAMIPGAFPWMLIAIFVVIFASFC